MPARVFIIDDDERSRQNIEDIIESSKDLELCGRCRSSEGALDQLSSVHADVVLIDVSLPGSSGIELLGQIRARFPHLVCVILSGYRSVKYATQARTAGAAAYIVNNDIDRLGGVLRDVLKDGAPFYAYGLGGK